MRLLISVWFEIFLSQLNIAKHIWAYPKLKSSKKIFHIIITIVITIISIITIILLLLQPSGLILEQKLYWI